MKTRLLEWFSHQIELGLENDQEFGYIKIDPQLTELTLFDGT